MAAKDVSASWYAPNQQAVGQPGPARTDGGDAKAADDGTFDPGSVTIDEVKAYVDANPNERDAVLKAEKAGKNRTTLVDWFAAD